MADNPAVTPASDIAAVVVTYGARLHLLEPTIAGVTRQRGVSRVFVVDNGSAPAVGRWLAGAVLRDPRLVVVRRDENLGSAGGFRSGLSAAATADARFVWTLDDDTEPEEGAAEALLSAWKELDAASPGPTALLSQRFETARYLRERAWNENAAFGVDLLSRLGLTRARDAGSARVQPGAGVATDALVRLRMGPWSGLFFERSLLDRIGLPDERFVSYEDDHEFSLRITRAGGGILLVPGSRLRTLEPSWLDRPGRTLVSAKLNAGSPESEDSGLADVDRVYYGARNRVHLEVRHLATNRLRYFLNLTACVVRVTLSGLGPGTRRRTRWFLAGVADGLRGRLGRRGRGPREPRLRTR